MEFQSKLKNKVLNGQAREIVANVIAFMRRERMEAGGNVPVTMPNLKKVMERVAMATGVSRSTVRRINKERNVVMDGEKSAFSTPNKKRKKSAPKTDSEHCDRGVLRRYIIDYYLTNKKIPTVKRIHKKFVEENDYTGSAESLRRIMLEMGFHWWKTKPNRTILMEKPEITQMRVNFLRRMKQYRQETRPIIYMDETNIHIINKAQRLIIVHAGGENGFIRNACLMFKSNSKSDDYYPEMNFANYKKWLQEMLLPNLPPKSVLVIDKIPYHDLQVHKCPDMSNSKEDMKNWLARRNIPYTDDMLKVDLYTIIRIHEPAFKTFEIDGILEEAGHSVLRLPPYHPELNPMKMAWASLKSYVAERHVNCSIEQVTELCSHFFDTFATDKWKIRCELAKECEQCFIAVEPMLETLMDTVILNLPGQDHDSDSEDDAKESSDSDSDF